MTQYLDANIENKLYDDVCDIIDQTRYRIAVHVNSEASIMNWNVGKIIKENVLHNARAEYGDKVLKRLSERFSITIWERLGCSKAATLCTRCVHFF